MVLCNTFDAYVFTSTDSWSSWTKTFQVLGQEATTWGGLRPATLLKRDSGTGVFLWNLRNF